MMEVVFDRAENIVGDRQNVGYQHFLLLLHFEEAFFTNQTHKQDSQTN